MLRHMRQEFLCFALILKGHKMGKKFPALKEAQAWIWIIFLEVHSTNIRNTSRLMHIYVQWTIFFPMGDPKRNRNIPEEIIT